MHYRGLLLVVCSRPGERLINGSDPQHERGCRDGLGQRATIAHNLLSHAINTTTLVLIDSMATLHVTLRRRRWRKHKPVLVGLSFVCTSSCCRLFLRDIKLELRTGDRTHELPCNQTQQRREHEVTSRPKCSNESGRLLSGRGKERKQSGLHQTGEEIQ